MHKNSFLDAVADFLKTNVDKDEATVIAATTKLDAQFKLQSPVLDANTLAQLPKNKPVTQRDAQLTELRGLLTAGYALLSRVSSELGVFTRNSGEWLSMGMTVSPAFYDLKPRPVALPKGADLKKALVFVIITANVKEGELIREALLKLKAEHDVIVKVVTHEGDKLMKDLSFVGGAGSLVEGPRLTSASIGVCLKPQNSQAMFGSKLITTFHGNHYANAQQGQDTTTYWVNHPQRTQRHTIGRITASEHFHADWDMVSLANPVMCDCMGIAPLVGVDFVEDVIERVIEAELTNGLYIFFTMLGYTRKYTAATGPTIVNVPRLTYPSVPFYQMAKAYRRGPNDRQESPGEMKLIFTQQLGQSGDSGSGLMTYNGVGIEALGILKANSVPLKFGDAMSAKTFSLWSPITRDVIRPDAVYPGFKFC